MVLAGIVASPRAGVENEPKLSDFDLAQCFKGDEAKGLFNLYKVWNGVYSIFKLSTRILWIRSDGIFLAVTSEALENSSHLPSSDAHSWIGPCVGAAYDTWSLNWYLKKKLNFKNDTWGPRKQSIFIQSICTRLTRIDSYWAQGSPSRSHSMYILENTSVLEPVGRLGSFSVTGM